MPKIVLTSNGKIALLTRMVSGGLPVYRVGWFVNDYTPVATSNRPDFVTGTWGGYYEKILTASHWQMPTPIGTRYQTFYESSPIAWPINSLVGPTTAFGYYVLNIDTGNIDWAQRLDTPRVLAVGGKLELQPVLTLDTDTAP